MANPEMFQFASQAVQRVGELMDSGLRNGLLQKLIESGHPYGLLLSRSNALSANGSFESLINFFFPIKKGQQKEEYCVIKKEPVKNELDASSRLSSSSFLPFMLPFAQIFAASFLNSSLLSSIEPLTKRIPVVGELLEGRGQNVSDWSFNRKENSKAHYGSGTILALSSKSSALESAKKNPDIAQKLHLEGVFQQTFLAPIWLKLFARENSLQERTREFVIGQHGVELGTTTIKLGTFRGELPFVIKTPQGEEVAVVNPGEPIGSIHVSHQARFLRDLPLLEKAKAIKRDFLDLLVAIDQTDNLALKQATIIGISHLVRLFRAGTGMPTWKLDVLPELVQRFHQHDSQIVSNAFGGKRKVKLEDVEMMVLTPEMRRRLVAAQA